MVLLDKIENEIVKKIYILLKREVYIKASVEIRKYMEAQMKGEIIWQYRLVFPRRR